MSQHPSDDPERPFFATAAKGTEGVLRDELRELGLPLVKAARGGVHFGGWLADAMRACLHSRIALRVLLRQASFEAGDADALYAGVRAVSWERVLSPRHTLAVDATLRDSAVSHSAFAAQRVKDAIVDRLRDLQGARPSVDKNDPDVRVLLHWVRGHATLALDLAGSSLHARGYRLAAGEAPLRETLAAAIVRLSRWDCATPFLDPLCGAGTIAIEAAQLALGIAPGLARPRFGFERWASHGEDERRAIAELRAEARAAVRGREHAPPIIASDRDPAVVAQARANAERAGVAIELRRADVRALEREHGRAWLVTNPPYGERLEQDPNFMPELAAVLERLHGYRVCVLAGDRSLLRAMRARPRLEHALWNGPLECRLLGWEIA